MTVRQQNVASFPEKYPNRRRRHSNELEEDMDEIEGSMPQHTKLLCIIVGVLAIIIVGGGAIVGISYFRARASSQADRNPPKTGPRKAVESVRIPPRTPPKRHDRRLQESVRKNSGDSLKSIGNLTPSTKVAKASAPSKPVDALPKQPSTTTTASVSASSGSPPVNPENKIPKLEIESQSKPESKLESQPIPTLSIQSVAEKNVIPRNLYKDQYRSKVINPIMTWAKNPIFIKPVQDGPPKKFTDPIESCIKSLLRGIVPSESVLREIIAMGTRALKSHDAKDGDPIVQIPQGQVTVIGNPHGDLDVLRDAIYNKRRYVSSWKEGTRSIVIKGCMTGKAPRDGGLLFVLAAFVLKALYPQRFYILRGRYELSSYISKVEDDSLLSGISKLYPENANALLAAFSDAFAYLPLAAIIHHKKFVTAGGMVPLTSPETPNTPVSFTCSNLRSLFKLPLKDENHPVLHRFLNSGREHKKISLTPYTLRDIGLFWLHENNPMSLIIAGSTEFSSGLNYFCSFDIGQGFYLEIYSAQRKDDEKNIVQGTIAVLEDAPFAGFSGERPVTFSQELGLRLFTAIGPFVPKVDAPAPIQGQAPVKLPKKPAPKELDAVIQKLRSSLEEFRSSQDSLVPQFARGLGFEDAGQVQKVVENLADLRQCILITDAFNLLIGGVRALAEDAGEEGRAIVRIPEATVTLIGNPHGDFAILKSALYNTERHGKSWFDPESKRVILIKGGLSGHSDTGLRFILAVFALKALCPERLYILRGRSELQEQMTTGTKCLLNNLCSEFGNLFGNLLIKHFEEVFKYLPMAALVHEGTLVSTGGRSNFHLSEYHAASPTTSFSLRNIQENFKIPHTQSWLTTVYLSKSPSEEAIGDFKESGKQYSVIGGAWFLSLRDGETRYGETFELQKTLTETGHDGQSPLLIFAADPESANHYKEVAVCNAREMNPVKFTK